MPVGDRSILPGRTTHALRLDRRPSTSSTGPVRKQNEMWFQSASRMAEGKLLVGGGGDFHARHGKLTRLVGPDREAERPGVGDDEAVAAERRIDGERAEALHFERRQRAGRRRTARCGW